VKDVEQAVLALLATDERDAVQKLLEYLGEVNFKRVHSAGVLLGAGQLVQVQSGFLERTQWLSQMQLQKSQEQYQKIPNLWRCSIKSERHDKC